MFFTKQISNSVWYYVNYCNNIRVKKTFTLIIDSLLIEKSKMHLCMEKDYMHWEVLNKMTRKNTTTNPWAKFHGPNLGYVIEQYDLYVTGAGSVDPELQELLKFWSPSFQDDVVTGDNTATHFLLKTQVTLKNS